MAILSVLRSRFVFRVILNGVILLVVSSIAFVMLASQLMKDEVRQDERSMAEWWAKDACAVYQASPRASVFAGYPVDLAVDDAVGTTLASSASDFNRKGATSVACNDGTGNVAIVGGPHIRPPLRRLYIAVAAVVLLIALGSIPLARSVVKPLRSLVGTAARFGEGDLSARAQIRRADEIGELSTAFNTMATKLEAKLLAEKEMLANVSHELRTPLARVRVVLETAKEDPKRAASLLTEISRDLSELERLTDDVLATLRTDFEGSPGLRMRTEAIDLSELLRNVIARNVEANPEREVALEAPEAMPLDADPALLRRLFGNLIDNAQKYSPGAVAIHATDDGKSIVIDVKDDGIGVDREELERIFEPFYRSDRSRQRETGGTGLGLALCRRIVELHHGTIVADSGAGDGTTIWVRLPRAELSG